MQQSYKDHIELNEMGQKDLNLNNQRHALQGDDELSQKPKLFYSER